MVERQIAAKAESILSSARKLLRGIDDECDRLTAITTVVRLICTASALAPGLPFLQRDMALEMAGLLADVAPAISAAAEPALAAEEVYSGLGMASALLTHTDPCFDSDRISHTRIFAARLEILGERRRLQLRGDPLMREIKIKRAAAVLPAPGQLLN